MEISLGSGVEPSYENATQQTSSIPGGGVGLWPGPSAQQSFGFGATPVNAAPAGGGFYDPRAFSQFGGIDPNYTTAGASPWVTAGSGLAPGLASYLGAANAPGLAQGLYDYIGAANPTGMAAGLNQYAGMLGPQGVANTLTGAQQGVAAGTNTLAGLAATGGQNAAGAGFLNAFASGGLKTPYDRLYNPLMENWFLGVSPYVSGNVGDIGTSPTMQAAMKAWDQNVKPRLFQQMQLQGLGRSPAVAGAFGESLATMMPQLLQNEHANRLAAVGQIGQGVNALTNMGQTYGGQQLSAAEALQRGGMNATQAQLAAAQALGQQGLSAAQTAQQGGLQAAQMTQEGAAQAANLLQSGSQAAAQMLQQGAFSGLGSLQQGLSLEQQAAVNAANIANQEQQRGLAAAQGAGNLMLGLSNPLLQANQAFLGQQQQGMGAISQAGEIQRLIQQQALDYQYQDMLRRQGLAEASSLGMFGSSSIPPLTNITSDTKGGK